MPSVTHLWYIDQGLETPTTMIGLHWNDVQVKSTLKWLITAAIARWTSWRMTLIEKHAIPTLGVDSARIFIRRTASTFRPFIDQQTLANDVTNWLIHLRKVFQWQFPSKARLASCLLNLPFHLFIIKSGHKVGEKIPWIFQAFPEL